MAALPLNNIDVVDDNSNEVAPIEVSIISPSSSLHLLILSFDLILIRRWDREYKFYGHDIKAQDREQPAAQETDVIVVIDDNSNEAANSEVSIIPPPLNLLIHSFR